MNPASVVKIMISTDNHLGYLEKDPVRGDDSFRAFEEVLHIAKANEVDMVLLGGDLFHDNKPSRRCIVRTMQILRKMCLGYDDVRLAVRSDPKDVNYMNENYAISLPIFIIHGNHDDPTGAAGLDALSALDLLSEANLITYFGRVNTAKKIEVSPILLQKGATKVALYGLGNIRDEVLYDTWSRQRKVVWLSPEEEEDAGGAEASVAQDADLDDEGSDPGFVRNSPAAQKTAKKWFNIFALHQNRMTRGSSRGISETLLPPWLDYVVWGHEHDSIPELKMSKPAIVQPGSTVATSLSFGESLPKHAILLEVYKGTLKHTAIPLRTVRNFEFADVALSEQDGLSPLKPEGVQKYLEETVEQMIVRQETLFDVKLAGIENGTIPRDSGGFMYPPNEFYIEKLSRIARQPLIRLRVEISGGWESLNAQRFGQAYVGRSACSADMLHFYRQRQGTKSRLFLSGQAGGSRGASQDPDELRNQLAGDLQADEGTENGLRIPTLVQYYLFDKRAGGKGLNFLEIDKLTTAVDEFVEKSEARAIPEYVQAFLKKQQDKTLDENEKSGTALNEQEIVEKFQSQADEAASRVLLGTREKEKGEEEAAEELRKKMKSVAVKPSAVRKAGSARGRKSVDEAAMDMDEMDGGRKAKVEDEIVPPPGREEAEAAVPKNVEENLDEIHALLTQNPKLAKLSAAAAANANQEDDDDDSDEVMPVKSGRASTRGRGRGRGTRAAPAGRKPAASRRSSAASSVKAPTPARPPRAGSTSRRVIVEDSDEEDDDDIQDESDRQAEESVAVNATTSRRPRASASRPVRRAAAAAPVTIDISDDDEEVRPVGRKRKASAAATGSTGRARARSRRESQATPASGRRSAFANRAKNRRGGTTTVDLDEESGDDAM